MKYANDKLKQFITGILITLFMIGCSSGGGSGPAPKPDNEVPVAAAGDDQMVSRNFNVLLDGTDSSDADSDGDTLTYTWTQTAGTDVTGGTGSLSGDIPTFVAPADVGTLIFELVVNDGEDDSAADTLVIHVFENVNVTYFVDGDNGNDETGNGAMETPYASIARALCDVTQEQQDIYVMTRASSEIYNETVDPCPGDPRNADQILTIPTGTSLYGGYDASWMRDVANNQTLIATSHHGFIFTAVNANAWFSGFNVVADDSPDPASSAYVLSALGGDAGIFIHDNQLAAGDVAIGNSTSPGTSYGLRVALMETATIERNIISAGFGGDGLDLDIIFQDRSTQGGAGANGSGRTAGGGGDGSGDEDYDGGRGGNGGALYYSGATGSSGQVQGEGGGAGGSGGSYSATGRSGYGGGLGGNGSSGSAGAGGNSSGGIDVYSFIRGNGITGNVGGSGHGGGGGGGGSGSANIFDGGWGGGGGGGGGGGSGGTGGTGGDGGGASIGLFIASVTTVLIDDNEITSGVGGNGKTGGLGQIGGLGGLPGGGASAPAGTGGAGGHGGIGGTGGRGGAGGGGPSYGILFDGEFAPVISNNIIASDDGGTGGDGSTGGIGGNGGHSYAIYDYIPGDDIVPDLTANNRSFGTPGDGGAGNGVVGVSGVSNW